MTHKTIDMNLVCGPVKALDDDSLVKCLGLAYATAERFAPPKPITLWEKRLDCTNFGPVAPQLPSELDDFLTKEDAPPISEDCQNLNVYAPTPMNGERPVMVWIHGGSFTMGASAQPVYDGSELARRTGAVIVTINYRLGVFGFLRLAEATGGAIDNSGNEGLLDMVAALKWVQGNIASFGGNPENVTIFGESAGAKAIGCLLAMPEVQGLFHRAILQSGGAGSVHTKERSKSIAEKYFIAFGSDDPEVMRQAPAEAWLAAQQKFDVTPELTRDSSLMPLRPVIDGEHIPCLPLEAIRKGAAKDIQLLAGTTEDEYRLFSYSNPVLRELDNEGVLKRFNRNVGEDKGQELFDMYNQEGLPPVEILTRAYTDHIFRMPVERMLAAQAKHRDDSYQYYFTWTSPSLGGLLGACHALELGFVFGTYDGRPGLTEFYGAGEKADTLSLAMTSAWGNFATNGKIEGWPHYKQGGGPVMTFGKAQDIGSIPNPERLDFWNGFSDEIFSLL